MNETIINNHKFVVEDCLAYLKNMPAQTIDCVVCSPPYNIGINYHTYHDKKPRDSYLLWLHDIGIEIARILKSNGAFFLNIGSTNIDPWIAMDVAQSMRDIFTLQNNIMWIKSIAIKNDSFGHFKPISSKRFLNQNHESIFHFTLDGKIPIDRLSIGVPFKYKSNISRRNHNQDKRCNGNVWFIPYETVKSKEQKFNHPAAYPIALAEKCIKMHGGIGTVLDPFVGIGTTSIAAHKCGWNSIGIDIDQKYIDTAIERLKKEIG